MKRILHVVGAMNKAGAETMLMNLYREIDRSKFQFDFLYFRKTKCAYDDEIISLGGRILYCTRGNIFPLIIQIIKSYILACKYGPFHAIHSHTLFNIPYSLIGAYFARIPIRIAHSHNTNDGNSIRFIGRLYQTVSRWLMKKVVTKYVTCGNEAGRYLFPKIPPSEVEMLPNAIDLSKFRSSVSSNYLDEHFGIEEDEIVLLQVARLDPEKNHQFSINLVANLSKRGINTKLLLVGHGVLENQLKQFAKKLDVEDQIIWAGIRNDIPALMRCSTVFILPSFFEGFPVVLVEAQASRLPCVVSSHVTSEADLDIGLLSFLSTKSIETWSDYILHIDRSNLPSFTQIDIALNDHELTIQKTVPKLYACYE